MKRLTVCFLPLLMAACGPSYRSYLSFNNNGYHGSFYTSLEKMQAQHGPAVAYYGFKPGQKVASIGAQTCVGEAIYACFADSVEFYLEDIDSTYFTEAQAAYVWNYYGQLRGRPLTSTYKMVLGTPTATLLPENYFDKCLIVNSFHEFTEPGPMLKDLHGKLKQGGILYIDEIVPRRAGELHGQCNKPLYGEAQLNGLLAQYGFAPAEGLVLKWRKGLPHRRIYAYKRA
jgi:SAM-dependent methyltransferase